jgi:prepilin-type N-terminal cleavage/methylation domain-containing protein
MTSYRHKKSGFTLFEMLLVLIIMSAIMIMIFGYSTQKFEQFRRDKAALQMQQILNAGMAYYINNGKWPADVATLQTANFLQSGVLNDPWGNAYTVSSDPTTNVFSVVATLPDQADATILVGMLPLATTAASGTNFTVTAGVNVPGQNLNNARSVNFTSVYHHGACVPAPVCPGTMTADIIVIPVSVSGVIDSSSPTHDTYALHSFTAYAYGGVNGTTTPNTAPATYDAVAGCPDPTTAVTCNSVPTTGTYWRVCLQVVTANGEHLATDMNWGQNVSVAVMTRCVPQNEPSGNDLTVFTN